MLPERRHLFNGLGEVDSFIVDPHKWFFCTAGTCALLYREPALAARTHTQHGPYIDVLHSTAASDTWNPSDFAFQLTRRVVGAAVLVHAARARHRRDDRRHPRLDRDDRSAIGSA